MNTVGSHITHKTPEDSEPDLIEAGNGKTEKLMDVIQAAAERFDQKPEYRASIDARAELATKENSHG